LSAAQGQSLICYNDGVRSGGLVMAVALETLVLLARLKAMEEAGRKK
jgi:hypothetical protein